MAWLGPTAQACLNKLASLHAFPTTFSNFLEKGFHEPSPDSPRADGSCDENTCDNTHVGSVKQLMGSCVRGQE